MAPMETYVNSELVRKMCMGVEEANQLFTDRGTLIKYTLSTSKDQELQFAVPFELQ